MDKVFITGISGFIGGYLSERLVQEGYEVYGLCQKEPEIVKPSVVYSVGDLKDFDYIGDLLRKISPDFIIHLAARTEVEKSFYDPIDFQFINYNCTVNLIEKSRHLSNLKLFVFSSTMETYGAVNEKKPFDETTIQKPNAPYAVAKIACEYYLQYAGRAYNLPYVILRQSNTYGRVDNDFFVVEQIITQMLKNEVEINLGEKAPYRNFLFIEDLIELYSAVLKQYEKVRGEIFCTGPNNALSIEDLAKKIALKLSWTGKINWGKKPKRAGEINYLNSVPTKAKEVLGWHPKVSLDEGLDRTIDIWKEKLRLWHGHI